MEVHYCNGGVGVLTYEECKDAYPKVRVGGEGLGVDGCGSRLGVDGGGLSGCRWGGYLCFCVCVRVRVCVCVCVYVQEMVDWWGRRMVHECRVCKKTSRDACCVFGRCCKCAKICHVPSRQLYKSVYDEFTKTRTCFACLVLSI